MATRRKPKCHRLAHVRPIRSRLWHVPCSNESRCSSLLFGYNYMTSTRRAILCAFSVTVLLAPLLLLSARSSSKDQSSPPLVPYASVQEVMDGIVDPAADDLWASVETTVTKEGEENKQPHTPGEWAEVRRKAITLIEASTLLSIQGRKAAAKPFPAEAEGALDSEQIQRRLDSDHAAFVGFAGALRAAAQKALAAIDAKDPAALVEAGGVMDGVCEGCHMTFWYPNQVIPPVK